MNTTLNGLLLKLCNALQYEFGSGLKYYGEGVRSLTTNLASNYITADGYQNCSVDDNYKQTIFIVRENAETTNQVGGGMNRSLSRTVDFRLIANCETILDEYRIALVLNKLEKCVYNNSSFDQDTIARTFFGINSRNTESAFFTVSFSMLETINCNPCK